jgi:hypothetical protein
MLFPALLAATIAGTRTFLLGFTPWPADLSTEGFTTAANFAHAHGDIVSVMLIGGIPWPEALSGAPFPPSIANTLAYRPPAGKKLFVSIAPLNDGRDDMAPLWHDKDNEPLPRDWQGLALDSPKVEQAFLAFCRRVVDTMHPDYLAIGVEDNILIGKSPAKWPELKRLHENTYSQLKASYPRLPVFFTTDVSHYLEFAPEARGKGEQREVADLMRFSDVFAMSYYPYLNIPFATAMKPGFLDFTRSFGKPVAVSESGMLTRTVTLKTFGVTLSGSEEQQTQFESSLLATAQRDRYEFVINFATTDFDPLVAKLPPSAADLAQAWEYTGLQDSSKRPKPALDIWDRWLALSVSR